MCDKRFTFAYIFAAIEAGIDNSFPLVMPRADTETMREFSSVRAPSPADERVATMARPGRLA